MPLSDVIARGGISTGEAVPLVRVAECAA